MATSTSTSTSTAFLKKPSRTRQPRQTRPVDELQEEPRDGQEEGRKKIKVGPGGPSRGIGHRQASDDDGTDDLAAVRESVLQQRRSLLVANPLVQGTKKRDDTSSSSYSQDIAVQAAAIATASASLDAQDRAEDDAKRAYARQLAREHAEEAADGVYKGSDAYRSYIAPKEQRSSKIRSGPIRDSALNTRTTTVVDYQPAVCKDYKNTGFCGRGDTCIFLHDRSDVLKGWELDAAWEKAKADAINGVGPDSHGGKGQFYIGDSDDEAEDLPFACLICKKEFTKPVVTKCGHYFCQACALKRFAKTPKCFACSAPTSGIFNRAKVLEKRLEEKKMRRGEDESGHELAEEGLEGVEGLA